MGFEVSGTTRSPSGAPRLYRRPMPLWWWLRHRAYFNFIVRELTCVFVGVFAVLTLLQIRALADGPDAYAEFVSRLRTPGFILFNTVGLAALLLHGVTWFKAVPTTMVVRFGETRVPDQVIAGLHYVGWMAVSAVIAWILLPR
ncbi:MAG: fumarate reductase subunit C [Acidobacteria bacterium]|nr:fumarate reductase subunit C [Acidobacteriota bacterium]